MKVTLNRSQAQAPWSFKFVDDAGNLVVRSESYAAKRNALKGIESVRKNCRSDSRYEVKQSQNGKYFFNLRAMNGRIVATSTLFASEHERLRAITGLKQHAPHAAMEQV